MRTSRRVRLIRVLCLTAIALMVGSVLVRWNMWTMIPLLVVFRLALTLALDERRCPSCKGTGVAWRGVGKRHLVCGRCGGFGVVDRLDGRRLYAIDGNMRGRW